MSFKNCQNPKQSSKLKLSLKSNLYISTYIRHIEKIVINKIRNDHLTFEKNAKIYHLQTWKITKDKMLLKINLLIKKNQGSVAACKS